MLNCTFVHCTFWMDSCSGSSLQRPFDEGLLVPLVGRKHVGTVMDKQDGHLLGVLEILQQLETHSGRGRSGKRRAQICVHKHNTAGRQFTAEHLQTALTDLLVINCSRTHPLPAYTTIQIWSKLNIEFRTMCLEIFTLNSVSSAA